MVLEPLKNQRDDTKTTMKNSGIRITKKRRDHDTYCSKGKCIEQNREKIEILELYSNLMCFT